MPERALVDVQPSTRVAATVIARVEDASEAVLISAGMPKSISDSCDLHAGQILVTGKSGRATLVYPDRTRVELAADTAVDLRFGRGKKPYIERGAVRATVSKQPAGESMVFETPYGTATVLGTVLRVAVIPGEKGVMLLQVMEGTVRLMNRARKSVQVEGGFQARSSDLLKEHLNAEGVLKKLGKVTISFGPEGRTLSNGCAIDSGLAFDFDRGHGWTRPVAADVLGASRDELKRTFVATGTATTFETWRMRVPNGRYKVTVCVGGAPQNIPDQGPHHVVVQGRTIVNALMTFEGKFVPKSDFVVVKENELRMVVGGHGSKRKTPTDKDDDTILNYLIIEWVPE